MTSKLIESTTTFNNNNHENDSSYSTYNSVYNDNDVNEADTISKSSKLK